MKKVIFPLEVLSCVAAGSALFNFLIGMILLIAFSILVGVAHGAALLVVPLVLVPYLFVLIGLSWFLAALTCYVKDVRQIIAPVLTALLFLSPIFYPLEAVPVQYQGLMLATPTGFPVEAIRKAILMGVWPEWITLMWYWFASLVVLQCGYLWFRRLKGRFSDVL